MKMLTPLKAVKARCKDCAGGQCSEVRKCSFVNCTLWPIRFGKRDKPMTMAVRSRIREYCLQECMNNSRSEVALCTSSDCVLYPYRNTVSGVEKQSVMASLGEHTVHPEGFIPLKEVSA